MVFRGSPRLVRVTIGEGDQAWPEIVVRPRVQRIRFQSIRDGRSSRDDESLPDEPIIAPDGAAPEDGPALEQACTQAGGCVQG